MARLSFQVAFWTASIVVGGYSAFIALLMVPWLQRFALYAHVFHTARLHSPDIPEYWGFADRQVTPFRIITPDHASLYTWHVLPLELYYEHQQSLQAEYKKQSHDFTNRTIAFDLLANPQSQVIIYFHGNAGCVTDGWRTHTYKALSACSSKNTHVISFDYRGFGLSSSTPSESGLIVDGIAVVDWVMKEAKVPAERIVLVGQSLGTAVVTAVADHFATSSPSSIFAGVVLVSGFSDIPTLMKTYMIGGFLPILSPLTRMPHLQKLISANIVDTWESAARLAHLIATTSNANVEIMHAKNDYDIGWKHSNLLYEAAIKGIVGTGSDTNYDMREENAMVRVYNRTGKRVRRTLLEFGGHNQIMLHAPIALAVHAAFENDMYSSQESSK